MRKVQKGTLVGLCVLLALAAWKMASTAVAGGEIPIIDVHQHVNEDAGTEFDERYVYWEDLINAEDVSGVVRGAMGLNAQGPGREPVFSSLHDDWVLEGYALYPTRIIPLLAGFDPGDPASEDYVFDRLSTELEWAGIGELDVRNTAKGTAAPYNSDHMMEIYAMAGTAGIPVILHFDNYGTTPEGAMDELVDAIESNPQTTFVVAHTCMAVIDLMEAHPNLWCEYEWQGTFYPIPEHLIDIPPGLLRRVVVGADMSKADLTWGDPPYTYGEIIAGLRAEAAALGPKRARMVLRDNAARLFGL